jgi:hypothetical protein
MVPDGREVGDRSRRSPEFIYDRRNSELHDNIATNAIYGVVSTAWLVATGWMIVLALG